MRTKSPSAVTVVRPLLRRNLVIIKYQFHKYHKTDNLYYFSIYTFFTLFISLPPFINSRLTQPSFSDAIHLSIRGFRSFLQFPAGFSPPHTFAVQSIRFTGLNNLNVISITSDAYAEHFGFTQKEVDELLKAYDLQDNAHTVWIYRCAESACPVFWKSPVRKEGITVPDKIMNAAETPS